MTINSLGLLRQNLYHTAYKQSAKKIYNLNPQGKGYSYYVMIIIAVFYCTPWFFIMYPGSEVHQSSYVVPSPCSLAAVSYEVRSLCCIFTILMTRIQDAGDLGLDSLTATTLPPATQWSR